MIRAAAPRSVAGGQGTVKLGTNARRRSIATLIRRIVAAVLVLAAAPAAAGPRDDTLYWSTGKAIDNLIPPYFDYDPETEILSRLVWDTLFYREPNGTTVKPQLATGYKWVGATTLEIELRRGVTFHNGDRFSADDVVETLGRLMNEEEGRTAKRVVDWILNVEKLDSYKVRINLHRPMPHALEFLAGRLAIVPQSAWRSVPQGTDGRPDYRRLAPVGTGPYRVARIEPGNTVELERYGRYYEGPKGRPPIGRIVFTSVAEPAERLRQLLDGRQDWIWQLSKEAMDELAAKGAPVQLLAAPSMRVAFLLMDRAGRADPASPLRDLRVRMAIAHAIDRAAISRKAFGAPSAVLHAPCYPTQLGCTQEVPVYDYDPAKAAKLLSAAGYGRAQANPVLETIENLSQAIQQSTQPKAPPPEPSPKSLSLNLLSYRNHPVSEAIRDYLVASGITVEIDRHSGFRTALSALRGDSVQLAHLTWASYGMNDSAEILNPFFRDGALDYCRDNEVQRWLDVANSTTDTEQRKRAFGHALKRIQEIVCVLPLFNYVTYYAFSRALDFKPTVDDVPRFYNARWKQ